MNYKYIFSIVSALSLAQSAVYFHNKFSQYLSYAKLQEEDFGLSTYSNSTAALALLADVIYDNENENEDEDGNEEEEASRAEEELQLDPEKPSRRNSDTTNTTQTEAAAGVNHPAPAPKKKVKQRAKKQGSTTPPTSSTPPTTSSSSPSPITAKDETATAAKTADAASTTQVANAAPIPQPKQLLLKQPQPQPPPQQQSNSSTVKPMFKKNGNNNNNKRKKKSLVPRTREQAVREFYQYHHQEMQKWLNDTTLLDWNRYRRQKGRYSQFLDHFRAYSIKDARVDLLQVPHVHNYSFFQHGGLCTAAIVFSNYRNASTVPLPHVLLARLNQDFGALSSDIPGKTARLKNLVKSWKKEGCSVDFVFDYINHPDTLAIFTNQFQIYHHPKVISIPLGLSAGGHGQLLRAALDTNNTSLDERPQLLMVNAKPRGMRVDATQAVVHNFRQRGIHLQNTYNHYTPATCPHGDVTNPKGCYIQEMKRSKFIMSPGGLGLDCYRHWEALYLGCIPVLERNHRDHDGWFLNTLAHLPVAWIDDFADLTPEYLEQEYERLVVNVNPRQQYQYEKLTRQYWIQYAHRIVNEHKAKTTSSNNHNNNNNNNNGQVEQQPVLQ